MAQTALQDRPAPMLKVTPTLARGGMCASILTPANANALVSNPQDPGRTPQIEVAPMPTRGGSMHNSSPCRHQCHLDIPTQFKALVRSERVSSVGALPSLEVDQSAHVRGGRWQLEGHIKVGTQGPLYIYVVPSYNIFLANCPMHDAVMHQT